MAPRTFNHSHSVKEGWKDSIPSVGPRPYPDYGVYFSPQALTKEHRNKLEAFVGDPGEISFRKATQYMYLPFLMREVNCRAAVLDIAYRQNAHGAVLAVRGDVELFRRAKRGKGALPKNPHLFSTS